VTAAPTRLALLIPLKGKPFLLVDTEKGAKFVDLDNSGKRELQTGLAVGGLVVMGLATLTLLAGLPFALSDGSVGAHVTQR
jgi:hypothetical protein